MLKRFLAALLALAYANACLAQSIGGFVVPPDVRSQPGGGYSTVTPTLKTDGTTNSSINPNTTPAPQAGLTNIPNSTYTNMVTTSDGGIMCPTTATANTATVTATIDNGSGGSGNLLTVTSVSSGTIAFGDIVVGTGITGEPHIGVGGSTTNFGGTGTGGTGTYTLTYLDGSSVSQHIASITMTIHPCTQAKFRTLVGSAHEKILCDDPQRNYGAPGGSHCHMFFGNLTANAYSTYSSLRNNCGSDAAGYCANGTAYWFPAVYKSNPFSDGHNYAVKPMFQIVYYIEGDPTLGPISTNLPPGLRYVFIYNMDDQWAWLQTIIDNANTASGHQRYALVDTSVAGFTGSISGTTLTVTAKSSGTITTGARLRGAGISNNTVVYAQLTGTTGGVGTYTVNNSQTVSSETIFQGQMYSNYAYVCTVGNNSYRQYVFKNTDGSDPFGGNCDYAAFTGSISGTTLTVTAQSHGLIYNGMRVAAPGATTALGTVTGQLTGTTGSTGTYSLDTPSTTASQSLEGLNTMSIQFSGPDCWDGVNLWSPGGYKHVITEIYDQDNSAWVCPTNFYRIPTVQGQIMFVARGFADYGNWRLTSDDSKATACSCTIPSGLTFHTDWMNGWDNTIMLLWETNGIGTLNHTPHELDNSQVSQNQHLVGGYTGENGPVFHPQVIQNTYFPTTGASNMLMLPSTKMGPKTMNMHQ